MILSGQYSAIKDDQDYDFEKDENVAKWRGIFANSLPKVNFPMTHPIDIFI